MSKKSVFIKARQMGITESVYYQQRFYEERLKIVSKSFLIYKFLGKLAKNKIKLPEEVILCVCNSYLKNKVGIKDKWAWFMITAKECWKNYNASHNIAESKELNKLSNCKDIQDLVRSITKGG